MNAIAFDTLRFVKRLQSAGYTPEQAEAQAEAYSEAIGDSLTTKQYLILLKESLEHSIAIVRTDIEGSAAALRGEIREANLNLVKWIVPMLIGQTAIVAALVKLF